MAVSCVKKGRLYYTRNRRFCQGGIGTESGKLPEQGEFTKGNRRTDRGKPSVRNWAQTRNLLETAEVHQGEAGKQAWPLTGGKSEVAPKLEVHQRNQGMDRGGNHGEKLDANPEVAGETAEAHQGNHGTDRGENPVRNWGQIRKLLEMVEVHQGSKGTGMGYPREKQGANPEFAGKTAEVHQGEIGKQARTLTGGKSEIHQKKRKTRELIGGRLGESGKLPEQRRFTKKTGRPCPHPPAGNEKPPEAAPRG